MTKSLENTKATMSFKTPKRYNIKQPVVASDFPTHFSGQINLWREKKLFLFIFWPLISFELWKTNLAIFTKDLSNETFKVI